MRRKSHRHSKHRQAKHKKPRLPKSLLLTSTIIVVALILFIILLVQPEPVQTEPEATLEIISYTEEQATMFIRNNEAMAAECYVVVGTDEWNDSMPAGIVQANERKFVTLETSGQIFDIDCEWRDMNATDCDKTSFMLCEVIRNNPRLRSCLPNDIRYQHFCVGLITRNSSYCDGINIEPERTHCRAYIDKNPELCNNLDEGRDWCYEDFALNRNRKDLCEEITNLQRRNLCLAIVTGDIEFCQNLDYDIDCIARIAEQQHDISFCDFASVPDVCRKQVSHLN